uniref:Uncharacterized protein n=1 Tax=Kryptolebias marmoratus TaxID=37003 RepID=A0A3Q3A558_KRYMA
MKLAYGVQTEFTPKHKCIILNKTSNRDRCRGSSGSTRTPVQSIKQFIIYLINFLRPSFGWKCSHKCMCELYNVKDLVQGPVTLNFTSSA